MTRIKTKTKTKSKIKPPRRKIEMAEKCPSCGVPWVQHGGMMQTCAELRRLREVVNRARTIFSEHGPSVIAAVKMEVALNSWDTVERTPK
jgi:hypothetical protein